MNNQKEFKINPITGFVEYPRAREDQYIRERKLERKNSSQHLTPLE